MKPEISISPSPDKWSIRAGGAVLGETMEALDLNEGDNKPVLYFPKKDLAMVFFDKTGHTTTCPHKGTSEYYSIVTKSQTLENIAWEFTTPSTCVEELLNYIAFVPTNAVIVERL